MAKDCVTLPTLVLVVVIVIALTVVTAYGVTLSIYLQVPEPIHEIAPCAEE